MIAILGTGPAALAAATLLTRAGLSPHLFERRAAPGWKLLVAGASGLNITYDCPEAELAARYPARSAELARCFARHPREEWLTLLKDLGEEPYIGSSHRYFLRNRTAAQLLTRWTELLATAGATFHYGEELVGLDASLNLRFASGREEKAQTALLALGGGSWEDEPPAWPGLLTGLGLTVAPLTPANAGYTFKVPVEFFQRAEGQPVKGLTLTTARGQRQGELMITSYGLEGTPIYSVGCPGPATLDLKPDLAEEKLAARIAAAKGDLAGRIERGAKLSKGALLLLRALSAPGDLASPVAAARAIKALPIYLFQPRPLSESISARGGLSWDELGDNLEMQKIPGLFAAGEMVDWDAPTGGFLLQACVSMGFLAAEGMIAQERSRKSSAALS